MKRLPEVLMSFGASRFVLARSADVAAGFWNRRRLSTKQSCPLRMNPLTEASLLSYAISLSSA